MQFGSLSVHSVVSVLYFEAPTEFADESYRWGCFLLFFLVVKTFIDQCHRLRRFGFIWGTRPMSRDVGYINGVVSDDSARPNSDTVRGPTVREGSL